VAEVLEIDGNVRITVDRELGILIRVRMTVLNAVYLVSIANSHRICASGVTMRFQAKFDTRAV
jgi:hypothetical protein